MSVTEHSVDKLKFTLTSQKFGKEALLKKARKKFFSSGKVKGLHAYACAYGSKLKRAYENSLVCSHHIKIYENGKSETKYCKNRFCNTCSNIKCANDITTHKKQYLEKMNDPYFLTLTVRNVKGERLRSRMRFMFRVFDKIRDSYRKAYEHKIVGFLKLECTYNGIADTYHPHFHFMGDFHFCDYAQYKWLCHMKGKKGEENKAEKWCQDLEKVTVKYDAEGNRTCGELVEIFKYVAKDKSEVIDKKGNKKSWVIDFKSLDTIYTAMSGLRCVRFYGMKKEPLTVDETKAAEQEEIVKSMAEVKIKADDYVWSRNDWYSVHTGEALTGFELGAEHLGFLKFVERSVKRFEGYETKESILLRQKLM